MRILSICVFVFATIGYGQQKNPAHPARQGVALLIGNSRYADDPLESVQEDLRGMQPVLEALGFDTETVSDLDRPDEFKAAVSQFLQRKKADANDIVLVLYSGHGMQLEGSTYLLGKNYHTVTEPQAAAFGHAFSVDQLVKELEQAPPYARLVIVDACRINAFSGQGQRGGVALRQNYDNTIVVFSNEPGKTVPARAAASLRSPFIEALIYALTTSKGGIKDIFDSAKKATGELSPDQVPQMTTSSNYDHELLSVTTPLAISNRAAELVTQARQLYADRSWKQYLEVFRTAKAVTNDAGLKSRIDREIAWVQEVAQAEAAAEKKEYPKEAEHWDRASQLFATRLWTTEKAALARMKADRTEEAIPLLAVLSLASDEVIASRARMMVSSLEKTEPSLVDLYQKSRVSAKVPAGAEFELVQQ